MRIGGRLGFFSSCIGLAIAQAILLAIFSTNSFFWLTKDLILNVLIGVVALLSFGYLGGRLAGRLILLERKNPQITGLLTGVSVLLLSAFTASVVGFLQEGMDNIGTTDNPFEDYIFKPIYWILLFGTFPSATVGILFGLQVRKAGNKAERVD